MKSVILLLISVTFVYGWSKFMEVPGMYQGDIQLSPKQRFLLITGVSPFGSIYNRRWPLGKIPYSIERSIGSRGRAAINAAIADYHKYTCLRFHKRTNERNYISFFNGNGCNSPVGMWGRNRISLDDPGCQDKGTALHEIGHSIGLQHEQCRPDRDQYVTVHYNNINGPWAYAFNIEKNVDSLGTPYDFHSMMHYSSTAFAKRGKKTITTKDHSKQHIIDTYNRISGFSAMDIKQINLMYKTECDKRGGGTVPPNTLPPNTNVPPSCQNKDKDCAYFASTGWCTDAKEKQWMKDNCCAACKVAECKDRHSSCQEWANRNPSECQKNPNYMLRVCQSSCKQC